jgi:hypothetical protein
LGDRGGLGVVVADDGEDLEGGMVDGGQAGERGAQDGLLVTGRHDQRERQPRVAGGAREPGGGQRLRGPPGVQHPPQRGAGDRGQDDRDQGEQKEHGQLDR